MKINRALGLGLLLLILQFLTTGIWTSLERTVITALDVTQNALNSAEVGLLEMPTIQMASYPHTP